MPVRDGQLVRVQGIKTQAAERVMPILPVSYDLLIDQKGRHGNALATRRSRKRLKGLEPSTFCMASRRSSQLSYSRARPAV
jgi:hypothetical protein